MKDIKDVKITPSSTTDTLFEEIEKPPRRGRIYETRVIPDQNLSGPKYVFRTTSKYVHLDLGLLSETAQLELAWFLHTSSQGKVSLRVEYRILNFLHCTVMTGADAVYFTLTPAN